MPQAEILCLGNELLIGRTVNSNATRISLSLSKIGFKVTRHTVLPDDIDEIVTGLKEIRDRKPDVLVISGGLGVTHDDIQLACLAKALNRPMIDDDFATSLIQERLNQHQRQMTDIIRKVCQVPKGSEALKNSTGLAPGVLTKVDNSLWFSLPGVPHEMASILEEEIIPRLAIAYPGLELEELGFDAHNIKEPQIVPIFAKLQDLYPQFTYKSHPKKDKEGYWLALHVYGIGDKKKLEKATVMLHQEVTNAGGISGEISEVFTSQFESETDTFAG